MATEKSVPTTVPLNLTPTQLVAIDELLHLGMSMVDDPALLDAHAPISEAIHALVEEHGQEAVAEVVKAGAREVRTLTNPNGLGIKGPAL